MNQERTAVPAEDAAPLALRTATADDIPVVAGILCEVADGVMEALFEGTLPGLTPRKVIELVLGRSVEPYALRNILIAECARETAGLVFRYPDALQKVPSVMEGFLGASRVNAVRELLEARTGGALWVNTLWVSPKYRGEGLADLLIDLVRDEAREAGLRKVSLHCWADNARALSFYGRMGFRTAGTIHVTDEGLLARHPQGGLILSLATEAS